MTLFGLLLYLSHVSRRLYENLFVSIFSNSKINFFHFALGVLFYIITPISQLYSAEHVKMKGKASLKLKVILY